MASGSFRCRYFAYRADTMTGELKELFRIGRYSLLIGIIVLGACLTLGHFLTGYFVAGDLGRAVLLATIPLPPSPNGKAQLNPAEPRVLPDGT